MILDKVKEAISGKREAPEETAPAVRPESVGKGMALKFANRLPCPNLRGKECAVAQTVTYDIGGMRFASFVLDAEEGDVSLIFGEDEGESYLALSQKLREPEIRYLLSDDTVEKLISDAPPLRLALGNPPTRFLGWLEKTYDRQIAHLSGKRYMDGSKNGKSLTYALYISGDERSALEVERDSDGTLRLLATIYRPLSDIAEVMAKPAAKIMDIMPALEKKAEPQLSITKTESKTAISVATKETPTEPVKVAPLASAPKPSPAVTPPAEEARPMPEAVEIKETGSSLLSLSVKTARLILEEAERNQMSLEELVRKVIDLPQPSARRVSIQLPLSDTDMTLLAKRYGIDANERNKIYVKIAEDLASFAGEKTGG